MPITSVGIGAAVTPTVVKTTFSHYTNRKPRAQKPTAHISYDQGLHLIRSFLLYASHHTVEEVQAFTSQWVPHPHWIRTENVPIPADSISRAAELLTAELGEDGIEAVGGKKWWLWRRKEAELKGEWIEMRSDYNDRQRRQEKCTRVMMYIHGGAYFFGSVDEHRYQIQRHARKLQGRVFAPRYRLAPQFPFPCGMLDCLAAYLYLLTLHDPTEITFAGDSAGAGMVLSLLCLLRDQNMPLPAGAILISPWVDLTHSFPSLAREDQFDYIPPHGFMQKPSRSWPPPNEDELKELVKAYIPAPSATSSDSQKPKPPQRVDTTEAADRARQLVPPLSLQLDGKDFVIKEQIQLYTTNQLITHPLVSPVLQPSLGGLPPLLIMVGGGELLRDEQIYVAHKAADPQKYRLSAHWRELYDPEDKILNKYKPTPVQLQVWEDLCHVTPTLSFTRPAVFMYRSIAQFGAWALSRAQKRSIEILDDDESSTSSSTDDVVDEKAEHRLSNGKPTPNGLHAKIGKAGDPLPPFKHHMIRQQVDRHGNVYPLARATELPATKMSSDLIGVVKEGPIRHWLDAKQEWDRKYSSTKRKIQRQRLHAVKSGQLRPIKEGERPPPSALAGRLHDAEIYGKSQKLKKSRGLGMWSSWGWKKDEKSVQRDEKFDKQEEKREEKDSREGTKKADQNVPVLRVDDTSPSESRERSTSRPRSAMGRRKTVTVLDQGQIEGEESDHPQIPAAVNAEATNLQTPALAVDPPTPSVTAEGTTDQHLSPTFMPKWKNAQHLKDDSKDRSDAGSMYSQLSHMMPDNASTRAVFSAPGVQREDQVSTPTADNKRFDLAPSTHIGGGKDNLGGYDTPNSRRSLERLRSNQFDVADGQSVHSSVRTDTAGLDGAESTRPQALRNSSTTAVVQAEGIIDPVQEHAAEAESQRDADTANIGHDVTQAKAVHSEHKDARHGLQPIGIAGSKSLEAQAAQKETTIATESSHGEDEATQSTDEPDTPTATPKRPHLYDRNDSDFVTASENI